MVRTRSGRVADVPAPHRIRRAGDAPAGFPTRRAYHLSEGMKIALDYLNLPMPPDGERLNRGVSHSNRRSAKHYASRAREWAKEWYLLSANTAYAATSTPGLAPRTPAALAAPRWPGAAAIAADTAQILAAGRDLAVLYDRLWRLSAGTGCARRVRPVTPAELPGGARNWLDWRLRLACRNPATRAAANWGGANGLAAGEQVAVGGVDAAYADVAGGHAKLVGYGMLIAVPGLGAAPGNFMERLPEFLCQLGSRKTLSDYA